MSKKIQLVKENLSSDKASKELSEIIKLMRESIFPDLSDDELQEFMRGLNEWTDTMLR